jgi:6-pyruvoyltetrahydropterin/6-carboxytetrahydropterin synthase
MYTVTKRLEVSGAHSLDLPYDSKCKNLHGHNWIIVVTCRRVELDDYGMVIDFIKIKEIVSQLDHANINEILGEVNPTAENIACWLCNKIPYCVRVEVQESEGNIAIYESQ